MFDFLRKDALFAALDRGLPKKLKAAAPFHMKTTQDCFVYGFLEEAASMDIAEVGGGDSRLLKAISAKNRCINIEPFAGNDGGPAQAVNIPGVKNVRALLGEDTSELNDESFDVVFSISVVEHIPYRQLNAFFEDGLRILRPGGLWLHAIDSYLGDEPNKHISDRIAIYRSWASAPGKTEPVGDIFDGPLVFSSDMASNPDDIMHAWGRVAPDLVEKRKSMQGVSVVVASRKVQA